MFEADLELTTCMNLNNVCKMYMNYMNCPYGSNETLWNWSKFNLLWTSDIIIIIIICFFISAWI